jgi:pimeloyl-ACP methyl ester carboxylesterase
MAVAAYFTTDSPNGDLQVEVVYGTTGRAECTVLVDVPDNNSTFMLAVNGLNTYSRGLAERYGWSPVGLPPNPPATCGEGGLIANEAAAANAVAAALQESLDRDVTIYGCSRSGKVANWAAATIPGYAYTHVLIDSGGTLGLASARQVGRCGEPMAAMVDRWPSWLAHNASGVRDVRDWPANVDVGDLMLAACATGTRYAVSTSRHDLWNNGVAGLVATTVEAARHVYGGWGCEVDLVLADGYQHCGLF